MRVWIDPERFDLLWSLQTSTSVCLRYEEFIEAALQSDAVEDARECLAQLEVSGKSVQSNFTGHHGAGWHWLWITDDSDPKQNAPHIHIRCRFVFDWSWWFVCHCSFPEGRISNWNLCHYLTWIGHWNLCHYLIWIGYWFSTLRTTVTRPREDKVPVSGASTSRAFSPYTHGAGTDLITLHIWIHVVDDIHTAYFEFILLIMFVLMHVMFILKHVFVDYVYPHTTTSRTNALPPQTQSYYLTATP